MTGWRWITLGTAVGSAVGAGGLLVFSTFVPAALRRLPAAEGMAAMQELNVTAPRSPLFMLVLMGPGLLAAVLGVAALLGRVPHPALVIVGAAVYLVGVVGMTAAFHVPRNEELAALDAATRHGGWAAWLRTWELGNHVRTLSGIVAAGLFAVAALLSSSVRDPGNDDRTPPGREVGGVLLVDGRNPDRSNSALGRERVLTEFDGSTTAHGRRYGCSPRTSG